MYSRYIKGMKKKCYFAPAGIWSYLRSRIKIMIYECELRYINC
jgi:hypothetical protein